MKVAVSIPDPIFEAAERLAKQRCMARSQLFAEALEAYLEARDSEAITASLDEIYAKEPSALDDGLKKAQFDSIDHEAW
jgi:metal-responsive CopG/Arc/MetJ family transcriptional regulator